MPTTLAEYDEDGTSLLGASFPLFDNPALLDMVAGSAPTAVTPDRLRGSTRVAVEEAGTRTAAQTDNNENI